MSDTPIVIVLAGPTGAGKSTFAARLLVDVFAVDAFVNADDIARALGDPDSSVVAIAAGREMIAQLDGLEARQASFAFETTLASRSFAPRISRLRAAGYRVHLFFLWLPTPDIAIQRVASRTARGGHSVPIDTIIRRHERGLRNFFDLYQDLVDTWEVYDATLTPEPREVARGGYQLETRVSDRLQWGRIVPERSS